LTHASVRCNWCGAEITDPEFRERADGERKEYFAHQRQHDAQSLRKIEGININTTDPLWGSALPYSPSLARTQRQRLDRAADLRRQAAAESQLPRGEASAAGGDISVPVSKEPEQPATPADRFGHLEIE
jgi:hypothetical protein